MSAGEILAFDHVTFWVSNAQQAASYYVTRLGFDYFAYQGLETGSRQFVKHVVKQNEIIFVFASSYETDNFEFGTNLMKHGDGVKDIAFTVENLDEIFNRAKEGGSIIVRDIWKEVDGNGSVRFAVLKMYGDTTLTLVEKKDFKGLFLPNFHPHPSRNDELSKKLPRVNFQRIDHIDGNQGDGDMKSTADWFIRCLPFHRFWSVDEEDIQTKNSALRSIVVTNFDDSVKMAFNEPAKGKKKSQIQEFTEYYGGAGVQHIALLTDDIIETITSLKERGMELMPIPGIYFDAMENRLKMDNYIIKEDFQKLKELNILVDYDKNGYLLQTFMKNMQDRPTLFFEVIQRRNHNGFGKGNFKALFDAVERAQAQRGNL